jgi:putative transposase
MKSLTPLISGHFYHIYNRGNNREDLFREERNYRYFLRLYAYHVHPIADTFAYCLLKNHFHFLVRIRDNETSRVLNTHEDGINTSDLKPSKSFSNLFNAYTKAVNKAYGRTGSLFEERFGRIEVAKEVYFANLIFYIHFNPQKHGFVDDFREWPWSSYHALTGIDATKINRTDVLDWFGGKEQFDEFHQGMVDEKIVAGLIKDDVDLTGL